MSNTILTALILFGGASALYAAPVYSCGGGSACNGNLYAVWVVSQTATSYVLDVGIQVTSGYTGNTTDFLDGLAITPDNQGSSAGARLTGQPGGIWNLQSGGLNASGCDGAGAPSICAGAVGMGTNLFTYSAGTFIPKALTWQFTITGTPPSLGDTVYINYRYINNLGNNVGGLGSFDVGIQCIGGKGCISTSNGEASTVPEPGTWALLGGGLIGLYFIRRRLPV